MIDILYTTTFESKSELSPCKLERCHISVFVHQKYKTFSTGT